MKICLRQAPPDFLVGEKHVSGCWLHTVENSGRQI